MQAPKFVARSDQEVPMEVRMTAFNAPKPAQKPIYQTLSLGDGDAAVLALSAVREDPNARLEPAMRTCAGNTPRKSPQARRRAMPPRPAPMPRSR